MRSLHQPRSISLQQFLSRGASNRGTRSQSVATLAERHLRARRFFRVAGSHADLARFFRPAFGRNPTNGALTLQPEQPNDATASPQGSYARDFFLAAFCYQASVLAHLSPPRGKKNSLLISRPSLSSFISILLSIIVPLVSSDFSTLSLSASRYQIERLVFEENCHARDSSSCI